MMKPSYLKTKISLLFAGTCLLFSCSKTINNDDAAPSDPEVAHLHVYGLLPTSDDEVKDVPVFTPAAINGGSITNGLSYSGTLPSSYLLTTPAIRDQGQIGSCTGFCGSEANEILNYYAKGGVVGTQPTINSASSAIAAVVANKFTSPTNFFGSSGALAPLNGLKFKNNPLPLITGLTW